MAEVTAEMVSAGSSALHDIECGCPFEGEHAWADIEGRDHRARAVLSTALALCSEPTEP